MPRQRKTTEELERKAARTTRPSRPPELASSEVVRMLARRGFRPSRSRLDVPFSFEALDPARALRLREWLSHYGFRLFLRGALLATGPFSPEQATRYVTPGRAREYAEALVSLGLAKEDRAGAFVLEHPARNFGGTLEWFVGEELRDRLGFEVEVGLKFHAAGVGGDLDVLAAAEGKLLYLELKSSPPKHLMPSEVRSFMERVRALRPHLALFGLDTALRLADKVVPMFEAELGERPRQVFRDVWALGPFLYLVSAREDLIGNLTFAIGEGFRALGSDFPPARREP